MTMKTFGTNIWLSILRHFKKKLMTGLLVVIPLGITIFILKFLFNLADGVLAPVLTRMVTWFHAEAEYVPGLGMLSGLIVIYIAGVIAGNLLGRRMVAWWDDALSRIPVVKTIYSSSKQVANVFSPGDKNAFRRAVYVEFPCAGSYAIAFQTGTVPAASGKRYASVFVPTAPNPTGGYVLFLEEEKVYPADFGVEEAMKIVVSGGMVTPDLIRAAKLQ